MIGLKINWRRGRDGMVMDLQLPMQSVPNTTNVVESNSVVHS